MTDEISTIGFTILAVLAGIAGVPAAIHALQVLPPAAPAPKEDVITQLERLGALKAQGILTEEEFQAQKAKLLVM